MEKISQNINKAHIALKQNKGIDSDLDDHHKNHLKIKYF